MKRPLILLLIALSLGASAQQKRPLISFFNELQTSELVRLFADSSVIRDLTTLKAEIRMGLLDLTPERARIVQRLNQEGIPVAAWLLLPEDQGYWFHLGNGEQAIARYHEFKKWTADNNLKFKVVGLDMELDMQDVKLLKTDPWQVIRKLPGRLYDREPLDRAAVLYDSLLNLIRADGYPTESYYASFVKDEVALGHTAIQQLTGFMDIRTDREIPMLYSSFIGNADGLLTVYGRDAGVRTLGLGSTGGGVDSTLPTLSYEQLVHDIRLSTGFADELHIFSLEGCVSRGFLSRLTQEPLDVITETDPVQVEAVKDLQDVFRTASNLLSYPTLLFIGLLLILALLIFIPVKLVQFIWRKVAAQIRIKKQTDGAS